MPIRGDYYRHLEVAEFLNFGQSFRVFIYTLLDEFHPSGFQGALREAARMATRLSKHSDQEHS